VRGCFSEQIIRGENPSSGGLRPPPSPTRGEGKKRLRYF
jgi:hypothetical protein